MDGHEGIFDGLRRISTVKAKNKTKKPERKWKNRQVCYAGLFSTRIYSSVLLN